MMQIWTTTDHYDKQQIARQKSAASGKVILTQLCQDAESGIFSGRGNKAYNTNLKWCDCIDFARRSLPCKHMYKLAFELGCFDLSHLGATTTGEKQAVDDFIETVVTVLPEDEARKLKYHLHHVVRSRTEGRIRIRPNELSSVKALIGQKLIVEMDYSFEDAVADFTVSDLKSILEEFNIAVPVKAKRSDVVLLVKAHIPDVIMQRFPEKRKWVTFELNSCFEPYWGSLWHRLTKEYPDEKLVLWDY